MMQPDQQDVGIGALAAALAKAQAAFPAIVRDKEVDSRSYKFKYAPLDKIIEGVRPALAENGLAFTQLLDGPDLITMLLHESGATLAGRMPLPRGNGETIQQLGSAITYLRRYALQAMLGIAAEEDDDGEAAAKTSAGRARRDQAADAAKERMGITTGPVFNPAAAQDPGGLIGVAEKTKDAATFAEMRQGPDGHVLAFRLVEGRRAVKVVAIGSMAELVHDYREGIEGFRVTLWGTVEDEPPWTPPGATRPVIVQHVLLSRLKVGQVDLSAPDEPDEPTEAETGELFPVSA